MLNTQKLLYILPDVAYLAELLPAKKEHTFTIQSFRQINGEFLDDNLFITENVQKLLGKIESDTYRLILPDFLFTNTIVEIKETQEAKVKAYIKDELLPSLELTKETHEIETFILTQYNQISKVQLTALERSVLDPLIDAAKDNKVQIAGISPLSWTIKSVVSLEPSITVVQMGDMLYVAEHYIGVDQCTQAKASEIENVVDTVKTLKGAQPSIQTMYLLSNELVESKLKEAASSILPIQQLSSFKDDDSQMPSYVRQVIESGMKTFDIPDYPVPSFALPKQPVGDVPAPKSSVKAVAINDDSDLATPAPVLDTTPITPPPPPAKVTAESDAKETETEALSSQPLALEEKEPTPQIEAPETETLALTASTVPALSPPPAPDVSSMLNAAEREDESPLITPPPSDRMELVTASNTAESTETAVSDVVEVEKTAKPDEAINTISSEPESATEPNLQQFAHENTQKIDMIETPSVVKEKPPVIKNKSGTGNMLKMIFITLAVFSATVAVGVAIGLGVLSWSNGGNAEAPIEVTPSPVAEMEAVPEPTTSPSPVASASATVDTATTSILVVNATTTAGYAGSTKTKLDQADYGTVRAANARGEYEPGTYVLMEEEDPDLIATLEADTDLELEYATGYATEDPQGTYGAVIVLAE